MTPPLDTDRPQPADLITVYGLRIAARDGEVHQSNVRPIIRGRIKPQHIGSAYSRAIKAGLLTEVRRERSDDVRGRNTNKYEPVYALAGAA